MSKYWRQLDIFDPRKFRGDVHIVGCGGIGSPTALAIAKMGVPRIHLWDPDTVEEHNLPNQLFKLGDVGRKKVDALADVLSEFTDSEVIKNGTQVYPEELSGHVVVGVDNMSSRKEVFESVKGKFCSLVEARMGGQAGRIYKVDTASPSACRRYERTLYDDSEAEQEPCTSRAIAYNVFAIAAVIARLLRDGEEPFVEVLLDTQNIYTEKCE